MASTLEMLGEYGLGDLVQLDATTAGVVVRIEKDAARVRDRDRGGRGEGEKKGKGKGWAAVAKLGGTCVRGAGGRVGGGPMARTPRSARLANPSRPLQVLTSNGTPDKPDVRLCRLPDIQRKVRLSRLFVGAPAAVPPSQEGAVP